MIVYYHQYKLQYIQIDIWMANNDKANSSSKLEKMLATHNLQNLVFEKRVRKQAQSLNQPQINQSKPIHKHKIIKKIPKISDKKSQSDKQSSFKAQLSENNKMIEVPLILQQRVDCISPRQKFAPKVQNISIQKCEKMQIIEKEMNIKNKQTQKDIIGQNQIQQLENEQEQNDYQLQVNDGERRKKYHRKSKMIEPMKDEDISSQSAYMPKHKKKHQNVEQAYNLNRIFRKTPRAQMKNITIQTNIMQTSISDLMRQMPKFDIIHCSLPIQLMLQLTQMTQIIQKGFIFIWAQKGQIQLGYHLLNRWGFDVIDQIMWIKTDKDFTSISIDNNLEDSLQQKQTSDLFLNCKNTCLVGYKCPTGQKVDYCTKISNNIIFAEEVENKKPSEIYQIAQLIMPGSRRLQIGQQINQDIGWCVIKHKQSLTHRCHRCFKTSSTLNMLSFNLTKEIICQKCYLKYMPNIKIEEIHLNKIENIISRKRHEDKCFKCQKQTLNGFIRCSNSNCNERQLHCLQCFPSQDHISHNLTVSFVKKAFYNTKFIKCNGCDKQKLKLLYYECISCKQHYLCDQCFWKEDNVQGKHEYRLKIIKNNPQMKMICFECEQQCSIPYWSCQICQNWFWCGSCQVKIHDNYAHFNQKHHLALMI